MSKIGTKSAKAFTNLVISLSSYESARSVTELSESPLFHHQYSSIRDGIAGIGSDEQEQRESMHIGRTLCLEQMDFSQASRVLLQTDASSIVNCLLYTSPSPRDLSTSRMPSSA